MSSRIFISIAAYREHDLENTVLNALQSADHPERLRFVVCWQRAPDECLEHLPAMEQVELIEIPCADSRGVCWARHLIQQRFAGEEFAMQLDAHHRFVAGWDVLLVDMLEQLEAQGVARPLLTSYLPGFDPADDPGARCLEPWLLGFDHFDSSGVLLLAPYTSEQNLSSPAPTAFWSAHFSFSRGSFVTEVPIDPKGYFHGEEISTAIRGWTHGYDYYCPHRLVAWHEYSRRGRVCHWDDHNDWGLRNGRAIRRFNTLLGVDGLQGSEDFGEYGLGDRRTLSEYERFAGVEFSGRRVCRSTLEHRLPGVVENGATESQEYLISMSRHVELPMALLRDPQLQFVGLFANDANGEELHRRDVGPEEINAVLREANTGDSFGFLFKLFCVEPPATLTIWPFYRNQGWARAEVNPW